MLDSAGVPFDVLSAALDEQSAKAKLRNAALSAAALAAALAEQKALSLARSSEILVLGSDQTLETDDGGMLDKPGSPDEAFEQLQLLSGRTHRLHSAAAVAENGRVVWNAVETASLTMRPLSDTFLADYLDREYETIRWSVGGYHIEGRGAQLFERIEGSHFAILGMPLLPLLGYLRERGILLA